MVWAALLLRYEHEQDESVLWEEILARFKHIEVLGEPWPVLSNTMMDNTALPVRIHA
jgi:hypothetical protein